MLLKGNQENLVRTVIKKEHNRGIMAKKVDTLTKEINMHIETKVNKQPDWHMDQMHVRLGVLCFSSNTHQVDHKMSRPVD